MSGFRLRQVALVAADLERAIDDLRAVLAIEVAFEDPGVGVFGLRNAVMPIGDQFLEVVSPTQPDTTAGRYLERRGGDGGYMAIFQTRDLAAARRRADAMGVRVAWEVALDDIATCHLHPRDIGGAIVSLDEAHPYESWRWAGPKWRDHVRTERAGGIAGVEIQSADPEALHRRWRDLLGTGLLGTGTNFARTDFGTDGGNGAALLALEDDGFVTFLPARDGRGEGIRSIFLRGADSAAIARAARARGLAVDEDGAPTIAGVRFVSR